MAKARTKGNRYRNGRRKQPTTEAEREAKVWIGGTPETLVRINDRKAYWTHPQLLRGRAGDQCFDNAGVLCVSGWFSGHGFQPEAIRDVFRLYAVLWHEWYIDLAPSISKHERVGQVERPAIKTKREALFQRLDARLRVGSPERKAVHQLCIDGWFFDSLHERAERLANTGRIILNERMALKPKLDVVGPIERSDGSDREWLACALRGAFNLIDEQTPQRGPHNEIAFWTFSEDRADGLTKAAA